MQDQQKGPGRSEEIDALEQQLAALREQDPAGAAGAKPAKVSYVAPIVVTVLAIIGVIAWLRFESFEGPSSPAAESTAVEAPKFVVTLGQGTKYRGYTNYPITVRNLSGEFQDYIFGDCEFYSKDGSLVYHAPSMWMKVQDQAVAGTSVGVEVDFDRYVCRAWTR